MVAYSFKARFVEPILAGRKDQTIRNDRKRHARPGEQVQLYTAMRTKQCRLIGRSECVLVGTILIHFGAPRHPAQVVLNDAATGAFIEGATWGVSLDAFARRDGFEDFDDMARFWWDEHRTREYSGKLIRYRPLIPVQEAA